MAVIKVKNLSKHFGDTVALEDFSVEVEKGQVLGLLGPNGAGKTTFIKALVGGVKPTSGTVRVFGKDPLENKKELSSRFGYMPQEAALYGNLSAYENIRFFANLHDGKKMKAKIDELLEFLGIADRRDDKVQNFSGGMKQRVSLAAALIHDPDILFLDEPTAGLDPALKKSLWNLFADFASKGKTLIISTHLMEEAALSDNLVILREGKLVKAGRPQDLISKELVDQMKAMHEAIIKIMQS